MSQVSNIAGALPTSRSFFLTLFLGLAISTGVRAQGKPEPQYFCVPSDLDALIVSEGKAVQVSELKEGVGEKRSALGMKFSSDLSRNPLETQRRKEAYKVFSKQAHQGNPAAMTNLAVSSMAGWSGKPNAGAALYWLHAAADRGYGAAFYDLGILYFKGCGVTQDMSEAYHFFAMGAKGGYAPAQLNLGYFYDHGLGVAQDHTVAAHWYLLAAESGEAQAQYNLADLYLHGEGVPHDEPVAFEWYQKAALQGNSVARIMVGSMLAMGRGTSKDLAGAYFWTFAAVLQGDARGVPLLRTLESQLPGPKIEEAKESARLLVAGVEAAKIR